VALAIPDAALGVPWLTLLDAALQLAAIVGAVVAYSLTRGRTLSDLLTPTRVTVVVPQETSSITQ